MSFRRYSIRVTAMILALGLITSACGGDGSDNDPSSQPSAEGDSSPVADPSPTTETPPEDSEPAGATLEVWFATKDGRFLKAVYRKIDATPRVGTAAMEALLAGPNSDDGKVASAIPEGTELLGLTVEDGLATVDLSSEYESGGGSLSVTTRLAQVVFTLTQFSTVNGVAFEIDGRPVDVFSGEGVVLDEPQTRSHYEDIAPPIVVLSPRPDSEVSSPVEVSGTANVFEATVSLRVVDSSGRVLVRNFTTATCGTGCRGDYKKRLRFDVSEPTEAFIEAFEESAEDGSELFLVRVPVMLVP
jgi:germination protein M